ncbi:hypothetical protein BDD12DRAFT_810222 [Trichophaea hybrida]|nr:hypothetical protein BDD12DRAFT_810222 [Trichophaea hybrida]
MLISRLFHSASLVFFAGKSLAQTPQGDPCATLGAALVKSNITSLAIALGCLRSVPFDKPHAVDLLNNLRIYTNFIGGQAYYRTSLAPRLEIPTFSINDTIDAIETRVNSGYYKSGYEFWRAVSLVYSGFRDGHITFFPSCSGTMFTYTHNYPIVAISNEANGEREIYTINTTIAATLTDPTTAANSTNTFGKPLLLEKVNSINGVPAVEFLLKMSNSLPEAIFLYLDPDARWNALMENYPSSPGTGNFAFRLFFAGEEEEKLVLTFDSGKEVTAEWKAELRPQYVTLASFNSTKTFTDSMCYLNPKYFELISPKVAGPMFKADPSGTLWSSMVSSVLSIRVAATSTTSLHSANAITIDATVTSISASTSTIASSSAVPNGSYVTPTSSIIGYPTPISRGPLDSLVLFADPDSDASVSILRFPTFDLLDDDVPAWDLYFNTTLTKLADSGTKKLLLDVSGNPGGLAKLGKRSIRMLFPDEFDGEKEPEQYVNWRYQSGLAKILKSEVDPESTFDEENFANLSGANYTSVDQFLGPYYNLKYKDSFTAMSLLTRDMLHAADKGDFPRKSFWKKEDVIVVSNGLCSSTCHNLVELLTQIGVRSYAIGGRPFRKVMQAMARSNSNLLDSGVVVGYYALITETYQALGDTTNDTDLPKPILARLDSATIAVENKFRPTDKDPETSLPLFFTYTPACKKLPNTRNIVADTLELWRYVKNIAWKDGNATGCDDDDGQ